MVLMVILSACTFQTRHRGYVFPDDLENRIAGIKTTAQLQDEIGDPLARTMYGDEVWIYYSADENLHVPNCARGLRSQSLLLQNLSSLN